jgi:hypothetical protein
MDLPNSGKVYFEPRSSKFNFDPYQGRSSDLAPEEDKKMQGGRTETEIYTQAWRRRPDFTSVVILFFLTPSFTPPIPFSQSLS